MFIFTCCAIVHNYVIAFFRVVNYGALHKTPVFCDLILIVIDIRLLMAFFICNFEHINSHFK